MTYERITEDKARIIARAMLSKLSDGEKIAYEKVNPFWCCELISQSDPMPATILNLYGRWEEDYEFVLDKNYVVYNTEDCISRVLMTYINEAFEDWEISATKLIDESKLRELEELLKR